MTRYIFNLIFRSYQSRPSGIIVASLTYNAILALIPTIILTLNLISPLSKEIPLYDLIENLSIPNLVSNIFIFTIVFTMLIRLFLEPLKRKYSLVKALIFSLISAVMLVAAMSLFLITYIISNQVLQTITRILLAFIFSLFVLKLFTKSNLKYSFIFSLTLSVIFVIYINFFVLLTKYFIDYRPMYGILAPLFVIILGINGLIFILYFSSIASEQFTKISNVKILKK